MMEEPLFRSLTLTEGVASAICKAAGRRMVRGGRYEPKDR